MRLLGFTLVVSLSALGSDIPGLINELGSPRYAQREQASTALEKLGRQAMPALKVGRRAKDPEIRNRSGVIFDRIETLLLINPTISPMVAADLPADLALDHLSNQYGLNVRLLEPNPVNSLPRIAIPAGESLPFWDVVESVARQAGLEIQTEPAISDSGGEGRSNGSISLYRLPPGTTLSPSSVSGPFRVSLDTMTRLLERNYLADGGVTIGAGADPARFSAGIGRSSDRFQLNLIVMAEPRMRIAVAGPAQLTVASDDLGNSMISDTSSGEAREPEPFVSRNVPSKSGVGLVSLRMRFPTNPGRVVKTLKGMIPLTVSTRKEDPITIRLAEAPGKSFRTTNSLITVHEVKVEPNLSEFLIDFSLKALVSLTQGVFDQDPFSIALQTGLSNQIELVDQGGSGVSRWSIASQTTDPGGVRMTIRVAAGQNKPVDLRVYDLVTVDTQAQFSFTDIPLP